MRTLKHLRYALLLIAAFAYANGTSRLSAAPSGTMSCSECDENSPCDTECYGTYGEEPWETTCGAHRNWGGTCAGECEDGFCDPWESPSNCCLDCDPWHCPGICIPDWTYYIVSYAFAQNAEVQAEGFFDGCYRFTCEWREWSLHQWIDDADCEAPGEQSCEYEVFDSIQDYCAFDMLDAQSDCEFYYWYYWGRTPVGTPGVCE